MTLTPLILVDLLGVAMLNSSFGLMLMFRAIGLLLGTPIAGKKRAYFVIDIKYSIGVRMPSPNLVTMTLST